MDESNSRSAKMQEMKKKLQKLKGIYGTHNFHGQYSGSTPKERRELNELIRDTGKQVRNLTSTPVPKDMDEYRKWQRDEVARLRGKMRRVKPLPRQLEPQVRKMAEVAREVYLKDVLAWYEKRGLDSEATNKHKVMALYQEIDEVIKAMDDKESELNWMTLMQKALLPSDALVRTLGTIDLFSWILPVADPENSKQYQEIGRFMTIFFFSERYYKRTESGMTSYIMQDLEKILARYKVTLEPDE